MEVTLIRHLPTEWNQRQWLQGRRDIPILPLSNTEELKVNDNRKLLDGLHFDYVLSSPLTRTIQTADVYGYKPETDALLLELDFGPYEGRNKAELSKDLGKDWLENPSALVLGESIANLERRIALFLKKYNQASHLLVFGHGAWMRALISYHKYGHLNNMNKQTVENNTCLSLEFISV